MIRIKKFTTFIPSGRRCPLYLPPLNTPMDMSLLGLFSSLLSILPPGKNVSIAPFAPPPPSYAYGHIFIRTSTKSSCICKFHFTKYSAIIKAFGPYYIVNSPNLILLFFACGSKQKEARSLKLPGLRPRYFSWRSGSALHARVGKAV